MTPAGPAPAGRFVTFEGVEGSGKSTQLSRLAAALRASGRDVIETREPGGTEIGRRLRALLLSPEGAGMDPLTELLLYAADRAQHVREVVLPAVERGAIVLCDRYLDATLAYQGFGRRLGTERVYRVHDAPPLDLRPHRTVLLDLDPAAALARARARNADRGVSASEGRFEDEALAFHRRVREGYLELARIEPDRFRVVQGDGEADAIARRVRDAVADVLWPAGGRPDS